LRRPETIERERRWARPVAIAAFGVLVFVIASVLVSAGADVSSAETEAETLRAYHEDSDKLLLAAILNGIGFVLLAPVLAFLFKAAQARSDRMRPGLIGIVVAGPLFLAAAIVLQALAYDSISADFVAAGDAACPGAENVADEDQCVEDLLAEDGLASVAGGLTLAGSLGLVVGVVYTSLNAMRVGLLTRFLGTLGMAVGVASLFFGPVFLVLYAAALGFLFLGAVPGGRPPAWERGEAVPWPAPGEATRRPPEEPVEGRADEVFPGAGEPDESETAAPEPQDDPGEAEPEAPKRGSIADEVDRAAGDAPQKRKRRR
jgi:hypothetical protein